MIRLWKLAGCAARCSLALGACLAAGACANDDTLTCTLADCGGTLGDIVLVDEAGEPAAARGEYRRSNAPEPATPTPFDCSPAAAGRPSPCDGGRLSPAVDGIQPDTSVEMRFRLHDDSWSAWQPLALDITSHTDPDFNGPGCECTWYTATAAPIVVPAEARLPAR